MNILLNGKLINIALNNKYISFKYKNHFYKSYRNLFDKNNLDGTYSSKINVISGQNYKIYRIDTGGFNTKFRQLDKDGNIISDYVCSASGLTISENVTHLQINTLGNSDIINNSIIIEGTHSYDTYIPFDVGAECSSSKWNGKRWLVLGDSISTGDGDLSSYNFASNPYHYLIAKEKGIIVTNLSVSGYTTQSILENKVNKLFGEYYPELITIFCGVNDIIFSCDTETWYNSLLIKLIELYPYSTIGIILPLDYRDSDNRLIDKINIIKNIADKFNIKYLDMYKATGWDFKNEEDTLKYTCNNDGLHPNNLGHLTIKPIIDNFIENL